MADFQLAPANPLTLPSRRIKVHVTALGPAGSVSVSLLSDNLGFPPAHSLTEWQWLVQPVTDGNSDPVTIRLSPAGASTFPSGARFEITLEFVGDDVSPAEDLVYLTTRDASGLDLMDVVQLTPVGTEATPGVRMLVPSDAISTRGLTSQAQDAFTAVRRVLGVDGLSASEAVQVTVLLDGSASMKPFMESGLVSGVIEVLRGLSAVVAPEGGFAVLIADDEVTSVSADDPDWGEAVTAAMRGRGARVGFRSSRPELGNLRTERAVTYVVTDGPPADLTDLTAAGRQNHVVMLCSEATLRAWALDPDLPYTVWNPTVPSPQGPYLTSLVISLLHGCLEDESHLMRGRNR